MRVTILAAAIFLSSPPIASGEDGAEAWEARRMQCLDWLQSGYPSGIAEKSCTNDFNLPSAFLVKCARAARLGYVSETERDACAAFHAAEAERASTGFVRR